MTRKDLNDNVLSLIKRYNNVLIKWATGIGKSYTAIQCIVQEKPNNVLLLVSEISHKENWIKEFNKFNNNDLLNKITIECYSSLKNYENNNFDMIICDEAHHLSDLRLSFLKTIKYKKLLLLTATVNDFIVFNIEQFIGKIEISSCTLQEAIDNNIIPKPNIILIELELNSIDLTETIVIKKGKNKKSNIYHCDYTNRFSLLNNIKNLKEYQLYISCTQKQKYEYLFDNYNKYKKLMFNSNDNYTKICFLRAGLNIKKYLGNCKTDIIKQFIKTLNNKRYICFCNDISQSLILNKNHSINSKNDNSLKILEQFNNKEISNIFCVGMLQEGVNLTDIEVGILIQSSNNDREIYQKIGRVLRSDKPLVYMFYYKNTRDEEYIKNISELDKIIIKY